MLNKKFSGHNKIWGGTKKLWGTVPECPRGYGTEKFALKSNQIAFKIKIEQYKQAQTGKSEYLDQKTKELNIFSTHAILKQLVSFLLYAMFPVQR